MTIETTTLISVDGEEDASMEAGESPQSSSHDEDVYVESYEDVSPSSVVVASIFITTPDSETQS